MKKLLFVCLVAYTVQASAQEKLINLNSLIESKSFALIINQVEKKPGFNGPASHYSQNPQYENINPSVLTPQQRKNILDIPIDANGSNRVNQYYTFSQTDGSYFTALNLNKKLKTYSKLNNQVVLLIQDGNDLTVAETRNPNYIKDIITDDYLELPKGKYEFKKIKKNDNGYSLTYTFKQDKVKRKIYVDIDNEGNIVANGEPTKEFTTFFKGSLVSIK